MALYQYLPNVVAEAPAGWNPLHERYKLNRGVSVQEVSPGVFEEIRYTSYTDELGSVNLPRDTAYQSQQFYKNLRFFRGGYEHTVDDTTKADLIASGVAVEANFTLLP